MGGKAESSGTHRGCSWRAWSTPDSGYASASIGGHRVSIRAYATSLDRMERAARELIDGHAARRAPAPNSRDEGPAQVSDTGDLT